MSLEDYYSGDEAFARLARTPDSELDRDFSTWDGRVALLEMCGGDAMLARVVFHTALTHSLEYMTCAMSDLDGLSPVECMKTKKGQQRFKECLMR